MNEFEKKIRAKVFRRLRKSGFTRCHASANGSHSAYYALEKDMGDFRQHIRISGHRVPCNGEREYGWSWATSGWNIIINDDMCPLDVRSAYRELILYIRERLEKAKIYERMELAAEKHCKWYKNILRISDELAREFPWLKCPPLGWLIIKERKKTCRRARSESISNGRYDPLWFVNPTRITLGRRPFKSRSSEFYHGNQFSNGRVSKNFRERLSRAENQRNKRIRGAK